MMTTQVMEILGCRAGPFEYEQAQPLAKPGRARVPAYKRTSQLPIEDVTETTTQMAAVRIMMDEDRVHLNG
jgi:hypothetical protein